MDMNNSDIAEEAQALKDHIWDKGIEDMAEIHLIKERGSLGCKREVKASSVAAALNALGMLIGDIAREVNVPVGRILSVLTVALLGSGETERRHE